MAYRGRVLITVLAMSLLVACAPPGERASEFVAKAQQLYDAGDLDAALLEAKNAAQIRPKNAEARYLMAQIYQQEGKLGEVIGNLLIAIETDPGHLQAQLQLGTLYFYGEAYEQAAQHAEAAAKIAPGDAGVRLLQARLKFQQQEYDEGIGLLDAVLGQEPGNLDAVVLKVMAVARTDPEQALAIVDAALGVVAAENSQALRRVRLNLLAGNAEPVAVEQELQALARDFPGEDDYPLQLARLYRQLGRVDEAERVMRDLVARKPEDVDMRLGLVQFLAQARSPEIAEETLKAFIAELPDVPQFRQALGRRYEVTGRPAEALAVYRDLAALDPKSAAGLAARREIAKAAFRDGQLEEGRAGIDAILKDAPEDPDALVLRAGLRFDARQHEEAIADLRIALRRRPEFQAALLLMARVYVQAGDQTLATDSYRRLLQLNPAHPDAQAELVPILAARGDLAGAEEILQQHLKAAPADLPTLGRLAEVQLQQREYAQAEATARRIIAIKDQGGLGEFSLGRILHAQKKYGEAADAFRAAGALRPDDPLPLDGLVQALLGAGKPDAAIQELQAFLRTHPGHNQVKYLLGVVYAREGREAAARPLFDEIIAAQPNVAVYYMALAGIEPTPEKRIATLRRGHDAAPDDADLGLLLAQEYERSKRYEEAIGVYDGLVVRYPKLNITTNNLAVLLLDHRTDKTSFQRALQLATPFAETSNPVLLDTLGWAHYRNGDYVEAVRVLERAVARAPQLAPLHYHLGMARLGADNKVGAEQALKSAVDKAKDDFQGLEEARRTLGSLRQ